MSCRSSNVNPVRKRQNIIAVIFTVLYFFQAFLAPSIALGKSPLNPPPYDANWLQTMNYYRISSGLKPVLSDTKLINGTMKHVEYLTKTDPKLMTGKYASPHSENPASPYYSTAGITSGAGNLTSSSTGLESEAIDAWMAAPFHSDGILRENLLRSGFAQAYDSKIGLFHQGLSTLAGLSNSKRSKNIYFPGNNSIVRVNSFNGESPDPRYPCSGDWNNFNGLPIWASLLSAPPKNLTSTLSLPDGTLLDKKTDLCVVDEWNYNFFDPVFGLTGPEIIRGDHLIMVIPRNPLAGGKYSVTINLSLQKKLRWSFTVIPPLKSIDAINNPIDYKSNLFSWDPIIGSITNRVTGYRISASNAKTNVSSTFQSKNNSVDLGTLTPGDYWLCIQAIGELSIGACNLLPNATVTEPLNADPKSILTFALGSISFSADPTNSPPGDVTNPSGIYWNMEISYRNDPRLEATSAEVHIRDLAGLTPEQVFQPDGSDSYLDFPLFPIGKYSACIVLKNDFTETNCLGNKQFSVLERITRVIDLSQPKINPNSLLESVYSIPIRSSSIVTVMNSSHDACNNTSLNSNNLAVGINGGCNFVYVEGDICAVAQNDSDNYLILFKSPGQCTLHLSIPGDNLYLPLEKTLTFSAGQSNFSYCIKSDGNSEYQEFILGDLCRTGYVKKYLW
jgi:hypothetical protein